MKKETISKFLLLMIGTIGTFLVSEQVISGETLASIQGYAGMILVGAPVSVGLIIGAINLIPKSTVAKIVDTIGEDKVNKVFDTVDELKVGYEELKVFTLQLLESIQLDRDIKESLGVYENIPQDLKDRL